MARTTLGLDVADSFTSSETCHRQIRTSGSPPSSGGVLSPQQGEPILPLLQQRKGTLTVVKGMNCRMLPRLPCSRQSTHSSRNHCTNWVWGPAVRALRMEEMSRKRLAVQEGEEQSLWGIGDRSGSGRGGDAESPYVGMSRIEGNMQEKKWQGSLGTSGAHAYRVSRDARGVGDGGLAQPLCPHPP